MNATNTPTPGTIVGADNEVWFELEYLHNDEWYTSKQTADTLRDIKEKLHTAKVNAPQGFAMWRAVRKTLTTEVIA